MFNSSLVYKDILSMRNLQFVFKRYITIQQPATILTTKPVSLGTKSNKDDITVLPIVDSNDLEGVENPIFKTIGTPSSSLSATIPPSVPIHVKKGSIISIYSFAKNTNSFVKSKWEIVEPLRRLFIVGKLSSYQSIMGTVPLQILISAYDKFGTSRSNATKSFVNLTLDGSFDWVVLKTNSLQCYVGNSLNVQVKLLPRYLQNGLGGRGFTWLNGRGMAGIVGSGSVFKVGLASGEEIRVRRDNLLAISVNDLSELENGDSYGSISSEVWNSFDGLFHGSDNNSKHAGIVNIQTEVVITNNKAIDNALSLVWKYTKKIVDLIRTGQVQLTDYVMGSGNYVVVKGPRTVLIETGSGNDNFVVRANDLIVKSGGNAVSQLENVIREEEEWNKPESNKGDNLGVVRIQHGKATYKNLDNFDDEVKRIESLKQK